MRMMLLAVVFCATLLATGQEMNVAICNLGGVSGLVISRAKSEADFVYHSAGITILWHDCDALRPSGLQQRDAWFIIGLRNDKPFRTVGPASLDVMGKAFVEEGGGYLADADFQSVQVTAQLHAADAGALLGFVMAHELGHLLLGAGHPSDGVMQAAWGHREMDALRQRWLKFNKENAARIRRALEARIARGTARGK